MKEFGPAWAASGLMNYDGSGYWYHQPLRLLGVNLRKHLLFVSKTMTLHGRAGNMPLRSDGITPRQWFPQCIYVSLRSWYKGALLNAVGLSGRGAQFYLDNCGFAAMPTRPFMLSFMSVAASKPERLEELRQFVDLLKPYLAKWRMPVALQLNFSCPNVGIDHQHLVEEVNEALEIAAELDIRLVVKLNVLVTAQAAKLIADHPICDALCVSNTIPWGALPERIDWQDLFGCQESPLLKRVGQAGGLSGKPLLPLLLEWLREARAIGIKKHINAGGGIYHPLDVNEVVRAGANSISVGSVVLMRPWHTAEIIRSARRLF